MDISSVPGGAAEPQGQVVQGGGQLPSVIGGQTYTDLHRLTPTSAPLLVNFQCN